MRKTLEIIALVLTIAASLVAIIVFFSGQNSLPALISGSTPTAISSSSTPTPIAISSSSTPTPTINTSSSFLVNVFLGTAAILFVISFVIIMSGAEGVKKMTSCSLTIQGIFFMFGGCLLPMALSSLALEFLKMMVVVPLNTVLLSYLIVCIISLLSSYFVKRWLISLK